MWNSNTKRVHISQAVREDPEELRNTFPPLTGRKVAMGDVFTSCNWVLRDGLVCIHFFGRCLMLIHTNRAPKTATKRVFLITDDDNPHPGSKQLITSAQTTLIVSNVLQYSNYSDHRRRI